MHCNSDSSFAKKIAAVVAVSPLALDFSQDEELRKGIKKYATPILDICGTDDVMIINARRYDTLINNLNPPVKYKLIEIANGNIQFQILHIIQNLHLAILE